MNSTEAFLDTLSIEGAKRKSCKYVVPKRDPESSPEDPELTFRKKEKKEEKKEHKKNQARIKKDRAHARDDKAINQELDIEKGYDDVPEEIVLRCSEEKEDRELDVDHNLAFGYTEDDIWKSIEWFLNNYLQYTQFDNYEDTDIYESSGYEHFKPEMGGYFDSEEPENPDICTACGCDHSIPSRLSQIESS